MISVGLLQKNKNKIVTVSQRYKPNSLLKKTSNILTDLSSLATI